MIESRHLLHFLEIAQQGSFRTAARALNISQPAISRSIQKLEAHLGVKLFDRGHAKVKLTVFGEALFPRAATIVNSLNDADQLMMSLKGLETGEFRVGFGPVYTDLIAVPSISKFSNMYSRVKIQMLTGRFTDLISALDDGRIDLFVGETSTLSPINKYNVAPLKERVGVYFCRDNHPILCEKKITSNNLELYPLITCQLPIRLFSIVKTSGDDPQIEKQTFIHSDIVCDSFHLSKQIVVNSDAIGLIPKTLIKRELDKGKLRTLDFKHKKIATSSGIVSLAERTPSPAVEKYIEIVKDLDKKL